MSTDILPPAHPHPVLPKTQRVDFAISLLLARQGLSPEQIHGLIAQLQAARKELDIRHVAWAPPAQWAADVEHSQ